MKRVMMVMVLVVVAALIASAENIHAREVKGVEFPETVTFSGKTLTLNGVGIRKKLIISVYVGGLYLERPTGDAAQVIATEQVKQVAMQFLYKEVRADQLVEAWNEGFEKNAGDALSALKQKIDRFNSFFTEPMMKGERMSFTNVPGRGTEVNIKGDIKGVIEGEDFMKALFSVWFGPEPPSGGLKDGMLGE